METTLAKHEITITAKVHAGDNPQVTLLLNGEPIGYYGPYSSWSAAEAAARDLIDASRAMLGRELQRMREHIERLKSTE